MRTQIAAALKRHERETASGVTVAVIGVAAVATLGAGTAAAHGMVTSGEIRNQTIRAWDIHAGGVGQSEIRRGGVDNSEIENQGIKSWDLSEASVKSFQVKDGSVHEKDLSQGVRDQLGSGSSEDVIGPTVTENELGMDLRSKVNGFKPAGFRVTALTGGNRQALTTEPQTFATFPVEPREEFVLHARATLQNIEKASQEKDLDHGACRLVSGGNILDATAVALGQDRGEVAFAPVSLNAVIANNSTENPMTVELVCFGGGEADAETDDRSIADVSITGTRLSNVGTR